MNLYLCNNEICEARFRIAFHHVRFISDRCATKIQPFNTDRKLHALAGRFHSDQSCSRNPDLCSGIIFDDILYLTMSRTRLRFYSLPSHWVIFNRLSKTTETGSLTRAENAKGSSVCSGLNHGSLTLGSLKNKIDSSGTSGRCSSAISLPMWKKGTKVFVCRA